MTFQEVRVNAGVWVCCSRVVEPNSETPDSVKSFLVVPEPYCMSSGKLPYFSVPCCTWWGEDKLGY